MPTPVPLTEDRNIFLVDWGVTISWRGTTPKVIWQDAYSEDLDIAGEGPGFWIPDASIPANAAQDDTITYAGSNVWKIGKIQADGTGWSWVRTYRTS